MTDRLLECLQHNPEWPIGPMTGVSEAGENATLARGARAWRPGRLPTQPGPLIGRENDLVAVRSVLLRDEVRLLTLWGPAGVGKTRLALAVAADPSLEAEFKDDIVFVDLAAVPDAHAVLPAIAEAFGLRDTPHALLLERIEAHLNTRHVLLVLDNLEHVLDSAPRLAPLLVSCPSLKILTTSRAALRLRWEHAFPVPPLAVPHDTLPTDARSAASYSGVALFVERARAARPDFELTDVNAPLVGELCARLDGLPLALEFAAARIKGLPLLVLLTRLEDRLGLLHAGALDLPPRQQTLRRALGWSFDLLDREHQGLFRRLAVFVDGCSPEAAGAVCGEAGESGQVLERLDVLVHHSLLRLEEAAGGQPRYTMLAIIREYAMEHLVASGEADEIRRRHAACYLELAREADSQLWGANQVEWLERLEREHNNLRAALRWSIVSGDAERGVQLGTALRRFWSIRGHLSEGREWLRQLLAMPEAPWAGVSYARGLAAAGYLAETQGDYAEAVRLQEDSLARCREAKDHEGAALALRRLGVLAKYANDRVTARAYLEDSLAMFGMSDLSSTSPPVLLDLGNLCLDEGDLARAGEYFGQSLAARRQANDMRGIALSLLGLARVALGQGDFAAARSDLEESLASFRKLGEYQSIASVLEVFACLAARRGGTARALRLVGAAEKLRNDIGASPSPDWQSDVESHQASTREQLGPAASAAAHALGRSMALDQAIQLCLEDETLVRASDCPAQVVVNGCLEEFTRREREVIELAVRGWSNRQIANELVISERTAEGHIHNILSKLQLDSRSQLAAWGARLGLVMSEAELANRQRAS
jgi:predicted ATPase/DNA-binding CsgD family transcriptional regulator